MVIVDVRSKGEYYDTVSRGKQSNIGHIKGAINITLQDLQQNPDAVKQLDAYKDKDIYLICSHSYRSRVCIKDIIEQWLHSCEQCAGRYDRMVSPL